MSFIENGSYPLMLIGRCLFGCGAETFHTARKIILFDYFNGAEYSLASGISLSLSRLASATQSNISPYIYSKHNSIIAVLSVGTILVYISFLLLLIFYIFIHCKRKRIVDEISPILETKTQPQITQKTREIHLSAIWNGQLDKRVLFLGFALCSFYDSYLAFSSIGSSYIGHQFGISYSTSSNLMSVPYYISAVLTPLFGYVVDRYGHRCHLLFIAAVLMLFGHLVLGYSNRLSVIDDDGDDEYQLAPIAGLISLGLAFAIFAAIVWPSFALIVQRKYLATVLGVFGSLDNGIRATLFVVVGALTREGSKEKYEYVTYLYLVLCVNNFVWVLLLWYYDKYAFGDVLNCKELKFSEDERCLKSLSSIDLSDWSLATNDSIANDEKATTNK